MMTDDVRMSIYLGEFVQIQLGSKNKLLNFFVISHESLMTPKNNFHSREDSR